MIDTLDTKTTDLFESEEKRLAREISIAKERVSELNRFIAANSSVLKEKVCSHSEIVERQEYYPGDYLNRSYIDIIKTCNICGKVLSCEKDKSHTGHYG